MELTKFIYNNLSIIKDITFLLSILCMFTAWYQIYIFDPKEDDPVIHHLFCYKFFTLSLIGFSFTLERNVGLFLLNISIYLSIELVGSSIKGFYTKEK